MNLIDKMCRKFRLGIPNLMMYIVATMFAVFAIQFITNFNLSRLLYFDWNAILRGEIWRVITFLFIPMNTSAIFILFTLYFYYLIGSTLEREWGTDQFTLYYLFGIVCAIIAGVITGYSGNYYLNMSLFFAFATLYPNHQVLLFFILPIKIKWLALLNAVQFVAGFVQGDLSVRVTILLSLVNYCIFFGPDIFRGIKAWRRRRDFQKQMKQQREYWRR